MALRVAEIRMPISGSVVGMTDYSEFIPCAQLLRCQSTTVSNVTGENFLRKGRIGSFSKACSVRHRCKTCANVRIGPAMGHSAPY